MKEKKSLAILGSTGSIGKQALEVISSFPDLFEVEVLTAHTNAELLIKQALEFQPNTVVVGDQSLFKQVSDVLFEHDIKVFAGAASVSQVTEMENIDLVLNAIVGYAGLAPTLATLKAKKPLALANKESLVIAGELVMKAAQENNVPIIPVDSEASALFQCLAGEMHNNIEKIILTASGGPFRGLTYENLKKVTPEEALAHPVWNMGNHISVDSATMINKGWEIIEAKWLFNLKPEQIDVVIHPEAVIHSFVQFEDGNMKAQLSLSEMKIPIAYALNYPFRLPYGSQRINFLELQTMHFEKPDTINFPCLQLAIDALKGGGNLPCALHASNEIAVKAFLDKKIGFTEITNINQKCLHAIDHVVKPSLANLQETHDEITALAISLIK